MLKKIIFSLLIIFITAINVSAIQESLLGYIDGTVPSGVCTAPTLSFITSTILTGSLDIVDWLEIDKNQEFIYASTGRLGGNAAKLFKIRISDMTIVNTLTLPRASNDRVIQDGDISNDNNTLYIVSDDISGNDTAIYVIDLNTFTIVNSITTVGARYPSIVVDNNEQFIYHGQASVPQIRRRVASTLAHSGVVNLNITAGCYGALGVEYIILNETDNVLYLGIGRTSVVAGCLVEIQTNFVSSADPRIIQSVVFPLQTAIKSIEFDGTYLYYLMTDIRTGSPACGGDYFCLRKVNKNNLSSIIAQINLGNSIDYSSLSIDPINERLFISGRTLGNVGHVRSVDLQSFTLDAFDITYNETDHREHAMDFSPSFFIFTGGVTSSEGVIRKLDTCATP